MSHRIVILTGCELRHRFVRKALAFTPDVEVLRSFCESADNTIADPAQRQSNSFSSLQREHLSARMRSEDDFFGHFDRLVEDRSRPVSIPRLTVNAKPVVDEIIGLQPDILVTYGCSIIRDELLDYFPRRILNVHLGLSPYYRGSGTNFWPLVNGEPEYVGVTFMYMDKGIDTGEIIHQIRARILPGDGPHQIGNRLIADMLPIYGALIRDFANLKSLQQPAGISSKIYKRRDFTDEATAALYRNFSAGLIDRFLAERDKRYAAAPILLQPAINAEARVG